MEDMRKEIDLIDDSLIELLEKRIKLGRKIFSSRGNVEDLKREGEIISRLVNGSSLSSDFIKKIYSEIFECVKSSPSS